MMQKDNNQLIIDLKNPTILFSTCESGPKKTRDKKLQAYLQNTKTLQIPYI